MVLGTEVKPIAGIAIANAGRVQHVSKMRPVPGGAAPCPFRASSWLRGRLCRIHGRRHPCLRTGRLRSCRTAYRPARRVREIGSRHVPFERTKSGAFYNYTLVFHPSLGFNT